MALLRRFESEAARDEARRIAEGMADEAALAIVRERVRNELEEMPGSERLAA